MPNRELNQAFREFSGRIREATYGSRFARCRGARSPTALLGPSGLTRQPRSPKRLGHRVAASGRGIVAACGRSRQTFKAARAGDAGGDGAVGGGDRAAAEHQRRLGQPVADAMRPDRERIGQSDTAAAEKARENKSGMRNSVRTSANLDDRIGFPRMPKLADIGRSAVDIELVALEAKLMTGSAIAMADMTVPSSRRN